MSRLEVHLFGPPRFVFDGKPWRFAGTPRCVPLLAYLAFQRAPVPRALAAAAIWPDELDTDARANLRRHLHQLRTVLPPTPVPWILGDGRNVGLNPDASLHVDVVEFESAIASRATRAHAVTLYDGDVLAGYDDEWIVIERERLRARYADALIELAAERRRERDFAAAGAYAERLLGHDDLREDAARELMAVRYESGDRGAALATYERFAARLRELLGVDPMPDTVALAAAIRANVMLPSEETFETTDVIRHWEPAFAGRDGELATLRRAWARAARGNGTTVFVGGEAGIGKSRLVAELSAIVRAQGGRVVKGATSDPEAQPYQALLVALRRSLPFAGGAEHDPRSLATLARVLPEVRALRQDLPGEDDLAGEPARVRLFEAIRGFVDRLGRVHPLLLVLEDLHWAGEATINAVAALARHAGSTAVLIVGTYRSEAVGVDHPLHALRASLIAEQRATSLTVRSLSEHSVGRMLECAELVDAPPELAGAIYRISDGNPLFAVQLARSFIETAELPDANVPRGIGEMLGRRIERLDVRARAVGEVAAALGETFSVDAVRDVGGWDEGWVLDALGSLTEAAMVRDAGVAEYAYAFTHALVAAALYEAAPRTSRAARHRRIARLLEGSASASAPSGAGDRASLESIARHWRLAGERVKASAAYVRAAAAALDVFARGEAVAFARLAYELSDDDRARFDALRIAAAAPLRSDDHAGRDEDLARLEAVAERLGDDELFVALSLREMHLLLVTRWGENRLVIDRMIALAERGDHDERRAIAYDALGQLLNAGGDLAGGTAALRVALAAAERIGSKPLVGRVRMHLVGCLQLVGAYDEAAALIDAQAELLGSGGTYDQRRLLLIAKCALVWGIQDARALEASANEMLVLARTSSDADLELKAHACLAYAAHLRFDPPEARAHYEAVRLMCERTNNAGQRALFTNNRGQLELEIGRLDWAESLFCEAGVLSDELGLRMASCHALLGRAECELMRGNGRAALALAGEARAVALFIGEKYLLAATYVALGAAHAQCGELAIAAEHLGAAVARRRESRTKRSLADDLAQLIPVLLDLGRADEAHAAALELAALAERPDLQRHPLRIAQALAREASERGEAGAAEAALENGRRVLEERLKLLGDDGAAYAALPFNRQAG